MPRTPLLALALVFVFAAVAAIMYKLMPAPLKDSDYFVIGSVATLVSLGVLFALIVTTSKDAGNIFFKKRKK
jgi:hypothetical protein